MLFIPRSHQAYSFSVTYKVLNHPLSHLEPEVARYQVSKLTTTTQELVSNYTDNCQEIKWLKEQPVEGSLCCEKGTTWVQIPPVSLTAFTHITEY